MRVFYNLIQNILKLFKKEADALNRVEIISENLLYNFDELNSKNSSLKIFPVLKSNAYGHGIAECAKILSAKNPSYFAVDSYFEALKIRKVSKVPVLIIGPNSDKNICDILRKEFTISVSTLDFLREVALAKKRATVHIAINTGMNREGFQREEIDEVIKIIKNNPQMICEGIFSHFADADGDSGDFTQKQEKEFSLILDLFEKNGIKPRWIHLGNSAGFLKTIDLRINSFRPGISLYGISPFSKIDPLYSELNYLKPVLRLVSKVVDLQKLNPGDRVSYNGTFISESSTKAALLPLGYNEALDRRLSNKGYVKYGGIFLPIAGRVCMNLTSFDTRNYPVKLGGEVVVISEIPEDKNSVENIAKDIGTIPYEVLVHINNTLRRIIV